MELYRLLVSGLVTFPVDEMACLALSFVSVPYSSLFEKIGFLQNWVISWQIPVLQSEIPIKIQHGRIVTDLYIIIKCFVTMTLNVHDLGQYSLKEGKGMFKFVVLDIPIA